MLNRRTLLAAPMLVAATPLRAATVQDVLVIAKQIDDITSLDPHESFEASGGEVVSNLYEKLVIPASAGSRPDAGRVGRTLVGQRGWADP